MSTIFNSSIFAYVFRVPAVTFVPTLDLSKPIDETLSRLIYNEKPALRRNRTSSLTQPRSPPAAKPLKQNL